MIEQAVRACLVGICLDARDETTGESYVIRGPDEYECLVELAVQVGFELVA